MRKYWETPVESRVEAEGPARVPDSVQVGNVRIAPATILAPMAGVTDTVFRRFIRNASFVQSPEAIMSAPALSDAQRTSPSAREGSGCGLIMTEFTSADGLF